MNHTGAPYKYSFGQCLAGARGLTAYNFSKGGMTAKNIWKALPLKTLMARLIDSYSDYLVRHTPEDFKHVGFIGTDIKTYAKKGL